MIARARLRRIEGSLSPRTAVVAWLADARSYSTAATYAGALLDEPAWSMPLERILDRVERATRTAQRRGRPSTIEADVARAFEEAITSYEVVLRLNIVTTALTESLRPRLEALLVGFELVAAENTTDGARAQERKPSTDLRIRRLYAWADQVEALWDAIQTEQEARAILERDHLEGHGALFTEVGRQWRLLARAGCPTAHCSG